MEQPTEVQVIVFKRLVCLYKITLSVKSIKYHPHKIKKNSNVIFSMSLNSNFYASMTSKANSNFEIKKQPSEHPKIKKNNIFTVLHLTFTFFFNVCREEQ